MCIRDSFVVVGGFAYECNNFSGTMDAVRLVVPDPAGQAAINVLLGPLCCALLLGGSSERIGMMLSVVVAFMIACPGFLLIIGLVLVIVGSALSPDAYWRGCG